jgi:ribonuclease P protein component
MVIVKPLVEKVDFLKLKNSKKKSIHFVCFFSKKSQYLETSRLDKETKKLGFIIPKKIVKKSSSRNLIKRWTRELIKTNDRLSKAILVVRSLPDLSTKKSKKDVYKELKLLISLVT